MLLYPPQDFDANEWFTLLAILFNLLVFALLPKRFPQTITPLIVLLSIAFPKVLDHTIAVTPLNLYNLNDTQRYEIFDLVLYGVYPAFGYLFLYGLDYFRLKGIMATLYMTGWVLFAVGFEYILNRLHVYVYTGWHLLYSLPVYFAVISLTYLFYLFVRWAETHIPVKR